MSDKERQEIIEQITQNLPKQSSSWAVILFLISTIFSAGVLFNTVSNKADKATVEVIQSRVETIAGDVKDIKTFILKPYKEQGLIQTYKQDEKVPL